jgi:hypothetical protein
MFFVSTQVFKLNNMGYKNDLYLIMIEAHIKENKKFHKLFPHKNYLFERKFKTYYLYKII